MFIVLEGCDGSGKTTQAKLLFQRLGADNAILTKEPSGTDLGYDIQDLINKHNTIDPNTELMLFLAARSHHVKNVIKPALNNGKIVICDRFLHSTLAYQGSLLDIGYDKVLDAHKMFCNLYPDLVFIIQVSCETIMQRLFSSERTVGIGKYDTIDRKQIQKISDAFYELAQKDNKCILINGEQSIEAIHETIFKYI